MTMFSTSIKFLYIGLCFVATLIHLSEQYGNGAPTESCSDMEPQHGVPAKTDTMPYTITVNKKTIKPGEKLTVTINSVEAPFKGYLLQARDSANGPAIGTFETINGAKLLNCGLRRKNNAITHSDNSDKKKVVLTWTAPNTLKGPIKFYVTIVKQWDEFWVAQPSEQIAVSK